MVLEKEPACFRTQIVLHWVKASSKPSQPLQPSPYTIPLSSPIHSMLFSVHHPSSVVHICRPCVYRRHSNCIMHSSCRKYFRFVWQFTRVYERIRPIRNAWSGGGTARQTKNRYSIYFFLAARVDIKVFNIFSHCIWSLLFFTSLPRCRVDVWMRWKVYHWITSQAWKVFWWKWMELKLVWVKSEWIAYACTGLFSINVSAVLQLYSY